MEASTLKRVLDFRLVYDCLADSRTGLVCVDTLLSIWPSDNKLPRDCERFLRQKANPEGFVNWEGFSSGLVEALRADEERLKKRSSKTSHLDKNPSYMQAGNCVATVTSGEIERFLSSCNSGSLVKALAKAGRDVHRWQVSIHKQNSTQKIKEPDIAQKKSKEVKRHSSLSTTREREELMTGAQVLENTQKWFQKRLAVLTMEQSIANNEQLCAEDVLAELEGGEEESKVLHHLKEINAHLSSLALTANSYPPQSSTHLSSRNPCPPSQSKATAIVEYPSHRSRSRIMTSVRSKQEQRLLHHSMSLPAENGNHQPSLTSRKPPHRSSSFNDKSKDVFRGKPVRAASSMTTLTSKQLTDYPRHYQQPSPLVQRQLRHSSSVHSLQSSTLYRPPSRTHSTHSLTHNHLIVSEVL